MYGDHPIGLVIPAYNEAGNVGAVIDAVPAYVDRTYVVDDASTDGTWGEVRRHAIVQNAGPFEPVSDREQSPVIADGGRAESRAVVPIRHETNAGRGAAVKTGYRRALADGMAAIAVVDGDGQMDPRILDRFLDPIVNGQADYVKGNRLSSPAHRAEMSRWRVFGNTVLTYLTKTASGYWDMTDPQNGYTAISSRTLRRIDLHSLYDDYGFLNDLLVKLNRANARVVDVPMAAEYGDEQSGIRYSSFVPKLSVLLLRNFVWRIGTKYLLRDVHPIGGLYLLGGIGTLGGLTAGLLSLGSGLGGGQGPLAGVLLIAGLACFALGMLWERAHDGVLGGRVDPPVEDGTP